MKRLIKLAALVLFAAVVFTATLGITGDDVPTLKSVTFSNGEAGFRLAAAEPNPLREQLLERLKAKVELMNDEQLQEALDTTDAEIRELDADKRLQNARETLAAIVNECQGTRASAVAERMIEAGDIPARGVPVFPQGGTYYPANAPQTSPYGSQ